MLSIPTFFPTLFLGCIHEDLVVFPSSSNIAMTFCRFLFKFIQGFTLRMGARKTWHIAYIVNWPWPRAPVISLRLLRELHRLVDKLFSWPAHAGGLFLFRLAVEVAGPVATGAGAAGTLQLKLKRGIDVKITDVRKRYISTKMLQLFDLPLSYDWYKYG